MRVFSLENITFASGWELTKLVCGLKPSSKTSVQLVRSLVVSVIALAVDFGSLVAFKEILQMQYLVAAALSFCLGVVTNYGLSIVWVFADRKLASRHKEFMLFFVISVIGLLLNLMIIFSIVEHAGVDYRYAKLISAVVVFFWNFLARKKVLY